MMYNILLATDYPIISQGLSAIAKDVIQEEIALLVATSFEEAESVLATEKVELLLLDLQEVAYKLTKTHGKANFKHFIKASPLLKVIVFYEKMDMELIRWMYQLGVQAVLGKCSTLKDIQCCLKKVYDGDLYIQNEILVNFINEPLKPKKVIAPKLTRRESIVAELLVKGKSNAQICKLLQLQPSTVSTFKHSVFRKLRINTVIELEKFILVAV